MFGELAKLLEGAAGFGALDVSRDEIRSAFDSLYTRLRLFSDSVERWRLRAPRQRGGGLLPWHRPGLSRIEQEIARCEFAVRHHLPAIYGRKLRRLNQLLRGAASDPAQTGLPGRLGGGKRRIGQYQRSARGKAGVRAGATRVSHSSMLPTAARRSDFDSALLRARASARAQNR